MKAVGLVTEYNPLHNGHIYHIKKSLEMTEADVCVAVMSGDFVQRGEPAIIDKYSRARAAIDCGINLLVELPSYYALSSAEQFADGAVKTLAALGADSLVFGSECGEIDLLKKIANILTDEPDEYKELLKKCLSSGMTFPKARQTALEGIMGESFEQLLSNPNNILGVEYLKAVSKQKTAITPYTLKRVGAGYHESGIKDTNIFSSATAIRESFSAQWAENNMRIAQQAENAVFFKTMPESMAEIMKNQYKRTTPVELDDFSALLNYKLLQIFSECIYDKNEIAKKLSCYVDITPELGNRIFVCFTGNEKLSELALKIKSRQYTHSRICRCLMHILLEIRKDKAEIYENKEIPYIRVLGFDKKGQEYLASIKKSCPAPIITKTAGYKELLRDDIYCAAVYNQVVFQKFGYSIADEFRQGVYIKK